MKRIAITIGLLVIFFLCPMTVHAQESDASAQLFYAEKTPDLRIFKLANFLEKHRSPLATYAPFFIQKADEYSLPWSLVAAIAGVESTFGKAIPYNSFNAYGWANGQYYFQNWQESIEVVSKMLKLKYINRGATSIEAIARIYAPPSQTWAGKVRFFMEKIENYSSKTLELTL